MDKQVLVVPVTACEGVQALVQKRKEEVDTLQDEVDRLEDALKESEAK